MDGRRDEDQSRNSEIETDAHDQLDEDELPLTVRQRILSEIETNACDQLDEDESPLTVIQRILRNFSGCFWFLRQGFPMQP